MPILTMPLAGDVTKLVTAMNGLRNTDPLTVLVDCRVTPTPDVAMLLGPPVAMRVVVIPLPRVPVTLTFPVLPRVNCSVVMPPTASVPPLALVSFQILPTTPEMLVTLVKIGTNADPK